MVIDSNMYWLPESLFEREAELDRFLGEVPVPYDMAGYAKKDEQSGNVQITIEKPAGCPNLNYVQGEYRLEQQLSDMDEGGVNRAILKIPGCHEWMSLESCIRFNHGMADVVKQSGGRLAALMTVPPFASKSCFDEIDRCRALGFNGVQLCAHYGERYLDEDVFAPFFEKLNEQKTTVYIHHTPVPVDYRSICGYNNLRRSYGRCIDQATAIGREIFSGFFDKYPNLIFVHSMLGGAFFSIANMMFPKKAADEKVSRFDTGNDSAYKNFREHIYFEMSHAQPWGKEQLECAVKTLGADRILFGTSYPVRKEWLTEGRAFVENLDITDEEKQAILHKNAEAVYHLL